MEVKIDLLGIWRRRKAKARDKLRASLEASRERYRRALGYKEITEAELYEELSDE